MDILKQNDIMYGMYLRLKQNNFSDYCIGTYINGRCI